jgi:hypothetical protein
VAYLVGSIALPTNRGSRQLSRAAVHDSRNLLHDLRLSFEQLLRQMFGNDKSLENQLSNVGAFIKNNGGSSELANMFVKVADYYAKYQNTYVKHNDKVNEAEVDFIFEITSSFMKHLVRLATSEGP